MKRPGSPIEDDGPAAAVDAGDKKNFGLGFALDYGPLAIFFISYKFTTIYIGTAIFMAASVGAAALSYWLRGKISPVLWLSTLLIVVFGGLTIWLHDQRFIQIKPTIIYILLSAVLLIGLMMGKTFLKSLFEFGFDSLDDRGWWLLSRNWGLFFLAMAGLNEILRQILSFDAWMSFKLFGMPILSIGFTFANMPMLMRHGLGKKAD